jgi:16S rRNA (uracil1498-N3)-methyltransferase
MRPVRFYCESIEPVSVLDPDESNHLSRVLRLPVDAPVELFNGKGTLAKGVVEQIQKKRVTVRVTDESPPNPSGRGKIILAVSFAKGHRFDWLVEKCTELGTDHIAAVQFERTVKSGSAAALRRLSKITIAAAKQSGRLFLPELSGPAKLTETVEYLNTRYTKNTLFYGSPDAKPLRQAFHSPLENNTIVFIGPEGGFTQHEIQYLQSLRAIPVSISPHILRVETAAAAFCALLKQI